MEGKLALSTREVAQGEDRMPDIDGVKFRGRGGGGGSSEREKVPRGESSEFGS